MGGAYRRGVTIPVRDRCHGRRDVHAQGALEVGAVHPCTEPLQAVDGGRRGVAIVVVGTHTDQRHLRPDGGQEGRVGRGCAVMRDREQFGAKAGANRVGSRPGEQVRLCAALGVAGEQHPPARPGGANHQGRLVGFAVGVPVRPPGVGPEHDQLHVTDDAPITRGRGTDRHLPVGRHGEHLGCGGGFRVVGAQPDRTDVGGAKDLGDAAEVVGVGVGHNQQVESAAAVGTEPPGRAFVGAGIHENPGLRGLEQVGVALPDVDGGDGQL